jgi:glycopeptide antibiotics resistance protein
VELPTVLGRGWALLVLVAYPFTVLAMRQRNRCRVALSGLLFLYATAVVAVTIFPISVVPSSWRVAERWWDVLRPIPFMVPPVGFALNIVMFMPFGVLVPLLWPRAATIRRVLGWSLASSALIEFTQLAMWVGLGNRRYFDVNDLFSNTVGAVFGFVLFRTLRPAAAAERAAVSAGSPDA